MIDWSARLLGMRLGLGDLGAPTPCHGYATCCECPECSERARLVAEREQAEAERLADEIAGCVVLPRQPWQPIVRRAA